MSLLIKTKAKTNPLYGKPPHKRDLNERLSSGFILLDKPRGPTSQFVVKWVKSILNVSKIGHTGTLEVLTGEIPMPQVYSQSS